MPEEQPQNATSKLSPLMNLQFAWFLGHFITGKEKYSYKIKKKIKINIIKQK